MTEGQPRSFVLAQFQETGSVVFSMNIEGVTPFQLLALAEYLSLKAKNEIVRAENERSEQEEAQRLSVPPAKIIVPK